MSLSFALFALEWLKTCSRAAVLNVQSRTGLHVSLLLLLPIDIDWTDTLYRGLDVFGANVCLYGEVLSVGLLLTIGANLDILGLVTPILDATVLEVLVLDLDFCGANGADRPKKTNAKAAKTPIPLKNDFLIKRFPFEPEVKLILIGLASVTLPRIFT